jgi:hypothetical protein
VRIASPGWNMHLTFMYALVLEAEGFEFVIDPALLWKPPRVLVRRGYLQAEVWLDETAISFMKPSKFTVRDQVRILELVKDNFDELLMWWCTLKDDVRRGRLDQNALID